MVLERDNYPNFEFDEVTLTLRQCKTDMIKNQEVIFIEHSTPQIQSVFKIMNLLKKSHPKRMYNGT